ncbi:Ca2+-binding RTX toxin-like protein [Inquilinus ginsengisoli]|uniref:calcium-binding protein n=1 Tax=Inquilinus ginsengisoli TaxID=363840 RepID=UPI003D1A4FE1
MPGPVGPEFVVNTWNGAWQDNPDVTTLPNGNIAVVWDSLYLEDDLDVQYAAVQIFRPDGTPVGNEKILSDLALVANHARIEALAGGGFAAVWEGSPDSVLERADIYTAVYDDNGNRVSAIQKVNQPTDDYYFAPEIVSRADGGYTVIWSREGTADGEAAFHGDNSFARSFSAAGLPIDDVFQLNQRTFGDQHDVRAVQLSNGNIVTVWESEYAGQSLYGTPSDLRARILGADGRPVTAEFGLSSETNGPNSGFALTNTDVSVAALTGGRFVATWVETVLEGQPNGDTAFRLYGRIFGADGRPEGATFQINTFDSEIPDHSSVVGLAGGGFVVVWDQWPPDAWPLPDRHFEEVFGQYFFEDGRKVGANFLVNQSYVGNQEWPSVTALETGGFFVAYESEDLDGDDDGIGGRVFSGVTVATLTGSAGGDLLQGGSGSERIRGLDGNDQLVGNGGDDILTGEGGNDVLRGGAGADWLDGGAGIDTVSYYTATVGVTVDLATGKGTGGEAQGDRLVSIENVSGSQAGDTLTGNTGANTLQGWNGNDVLRGAAGADRLDGGAGIDTASYWGATVGVTVNLAAGTGTGGEAQGDILIGIEHLSGSQANDTLTGNAGANTLQGWNGNDVLRGGAGADRLDGGAGVDTASYWGETAGVTVNLATGTGTGGHAQGDILIGIENVSGGRAGDTLIGSNGANALNGYEGNDLLRGGAGKDSLTGGSGADRFVFAATGDSAVGANADRITDFSRAQGDRIDLSGIDANSAAAGTQAFSFIGSGAFTHHAGQLRAVVTSPGVITIAGDVNGDGVSDFHIQLTGGIALVAGDFVL